MWELIIGPSAQPVRWLLLGDEPTYGTFLVFGEW